MNYYITVLKKYSDFSGRARRAEYWTAAIISFLISIGLKFAMIVIHGPIAIADLYTLFMLIPGIAVGVRRMHDTNRSGWWILLPIVNLIFAALPGDQTGNEYGPDPKAVQA